MRTVLRECTGSGLEGSLTPHSTYSLQDAPFRAVAAESHRLSVHFMEKPLRSGVVSGPGTSARAQPPRARNDRFRRIRLAHKADSRLGAAGQAAAAGARHVRLAARDRVARRAVRRPAELGAVSGRTTISREPGLRSRPCGAQGFESLWGPTACRRTKRCRSSRS